MTKDMAPMLVYTTKECNFNTTLLLLYTNMAVMTSHANQKLLLVSGIKGAVTDVFWN